MTKNAVIIPAAGSGERAGKDKILFNTGGLPLISRTLMPFLLSPLIHKIIITANAENKEKIDLIISNLQTDKEIITVSGGKTRTESVRNALPYAQDCYITLIHDGARPFVSESIIENVLRAAESDGAAVAAVPLVDTVKKVKSGKVVKTVDRSEYVSVQTPQAFRTKDIIKAYEMAADGVFTDDSALYERFIGKVSVVDGSYLNIKITTPEDFARFFPKGFRIGAGYDVHPFAEGRKLILGGVEIPHDKGLSGHSDADCLVHAVMDAILTASGNRDIGVLFPATDSKYLNISSLILLEKVFALISEQGYKINNISAEIIAEKPKLAGYIPKMIENMADILKTDRNNISIAATTSEGLGITGQERAIAVHAVASLIDGV